MTRLWHHLRTLWPGWTLLAPIPFVAHALWSMSRGSFHWENAAVLGAVLALFAISARTKRLLLGVYPIGLVGILYDTMRVVENLGVTPDRVHLCDLRRHELALFGLNEGGARITLHDWFQAHPSAVLDALCAVPYGTFIVVCVACAVWLYVRDYAKMRRFTWCFFALNVAGFVTYHVYPAAPPWYFHAHGCVVDLTAHASEGPNLARVDAWLGVHYFGGMYGRASDVFGAMPSLHVAYALVVVVEGWAAFSIFWRGASLAFYLLMFFASVYLDHHWVLDGLAGSAYCLIVVATGRSIARRWATRPRRALVAEPTGGTS